MPHPKAGIEVAALVRERPARAGLLERLGIDYCCGGKVPLATACDKLGLDVEEVCRQVDAWDAASPAGADAPAPASLTELVRQIVDTHHAYLRRELPRLEALMAKVLAAHGAGHPELKQVGSLYADLMSELYPHMFREEQVLFPWIERLERTGAAAAAPPASWESIRRELEDDHRRVGQTLERIRELTGDYRPPTDACMSYQVLLSGLAELAADLHLHIHKENNVLFPAAVRLEAVRAARN